MEAKSVSNFKSLFKTAKRAAAYLGLTPEQLRFAEKKGGVVIGRRLYVPSAAKADPVEFRSVNQFDHEPDVDF